MRENERELNLGEKRVYIRKSTRVLAFWDRRSIKLQNQTWILLYLRMCPQFFSWAWASYWARLQYSNVTRKYRINFSIY